MSTVRQTAEPVRRPGDDMGERARERLLAPRAQICPVDPSTQDAPHVPASVRVALLLGVAAESPLDVQGPSLAAPTVRAGHEPMVAAARLGRRSDSIRSRPAGTRP